MGRAERLAAARMAHDRRGAALSPRRPGGQGGDALAHADSEDVSGHGKDDGEVRRREYESKGWRWRVPDAGRLRLDQRGRAGTMRTADTVEGMRKLICL